MSDEQPKLTQQQWWAHLNLLSQKDNMEEFWYTYAAYLQASNIYSNARQILFNAAVKTVKELRGDNNQGEPNDG